MITIDQESVNKTIIHYVGNYQKGDGIILSSKLAPTNLNINRLLVTSFLPLLNNSKLFHFFHESSLDLNESFVFSRQIFNNPDSFIEISQNFARHLFAKSTHQKINGGELCIVYFNNCTYDNQCVDAIGIFKSEHKFPFLKFEKTTDSFSIFDIEGININKIEKGCLIINQETEKGFIVSVFDSINSNIEAKYWLDDFLHLQQRDDDYYKTQMVMNLCKSFVVKELPRQVEVSKAQQVDLLNKSVSYFKENETFKIVDFENDVISDPLMIDSFNQFKSEYEKENCSLINDSFSISNNAVKKQIRSFKSVIKLDKNFHIYIHGSNQFIQKGFDEKTGMSYYQLFFKEEL